MDIFRAANLSALVKLFVTEYNLSELDVIQLVYSTKVYNSLENEEEEVVSKGIRFWFFAIHDELGISYKITPKEVRQMAIIAYIGAIDVKKERKKMEEEFEE